MDNMQFKYLLLVISRYYLLITATDRVLISTPMGFQHLFFPL